jgi:hypothetical protein
MYDKLLLRLLACVAVTSLAIAAATAPVSGARPPEATDSPLGGQRAQRAWGLVSSAVDRAGDSAAKPVAAAQSPRAYFDVSPFPAPQIDPLPAPEPVPTF